MSTILTSEFAGGERVPEVLASQFGRNAGESVKDGRRTNLRCIGELLLTEMTS